jgi:hypothetical protein
MALAKRALDWQLRVRWHHYPFLPFNNDGAPHYSQNYDYSNIVIPYYYAKCSNETLCPNSITSPLTSALSQTPPLQKPSSMCASICSVSSHRCNINKCHSPGIPFRLKAPRSPNLKPEPTTKSLTVRESQISFA